MLKNTRNNEGGNKSIERGRYYLAYTILFAIMACVVFAPFYYNNKSFVWSRDGLTQHLPALTYWGSAMRQTLENIFVHHTFEIPMWDLSIGYGSDLITTLHYYAIGDPLNLFAVLVPADKTEYLYCALVILRVYLAGLTFSMYCRYRQKDTYATLVGALIYAFSGYTMYVSVRHPYFVNPMIYLPILLIGIEKIFKKQKPYLFIIITAISALSNFYFFYMLAILIFIYAVFRYIMIFKRIEIKELICWVAKFCGYFLIGTCIAMIILLPNAMLILGSSRYGVERTIPLFYSEKHYYSILLSFISANPTGAYTNLNFSPVALISIFVLFIQKKERLPLKIGLLLTTTFFLTPFFGYVLNGFASNQNRWIWGYAMLVAFISVEMIPRFVQLKISEKIKVLVFTLLYTIIDVFALSKISDSYHMCILIALIVLELSVIVILFVGRLRSKRVFQILLTGITCLGIGINAYFIYSEKQADYVSEFNDLGTAYSSLITTPSSLLKDLTDDSIYRYDRDCDNGEVMNSSMIQNLNNVGYRFSMSDGIISNFNEEHYLNTARDYSYLTLDNRTVLDVLASVKYFIIKAGKTQDLPYSYNKFVTSKKINNIEYEVYTTDNYLPLGYTYSNYITSDEFNSLSVTEKQWALLQGVVLEGDVKLDKADLSFNAKNLDYTITPGKNAKVEGNKIITTKKNSTVTLNFQGLENSETYLIFDKIGISKEMKNSKYYIKVDGENKSRKVDIITEGNRAYCGRNSFLCNLNYSEKASTKITLTFRSPGEYSFEDLSIVCQPMEGFDEAIQELKEDTLENIKVTTNHISGEINLDTSKVLLLAIPYSKGWTAKVDGKKQTVLRANSMYSGLLLKEGEHKIEFTYRTPHFKTSLSISILGILALFSIVLYNKKKDKKEENCIQ